MLTTHRLAYLCRQSRNQHPSGSSKEWAVKESLIQSLTWIVSWVTQIHDLQLNTIWHGRILKWSKYTQKLSFCIKMFQNNPFHIDSFLVSYRLVYRPSLFIEPLLSSLDKWLSITVPNDEDHFSISAGVCLGLVIIFWIYVIIRWC